MAIDDERWYFDKEYLENSPSRRCGIDAEKELSYRQQAANLIQDIGQKLKVTQLVINTAIVYMHRFYTFHSFSRFHRNAISSCAAFLAAKVEEQPRKLEHVIKVSYLCIYRENVDMSTSQYQQLVSDLVYHENCMLRTLGFNLNVQHPHTWVVKCCQLVRANKDLAQTSYFMATNSLHLTTMCLQYKPTVVACICIYFVCKWGNFEMSKSIEDKDWWTYIDKTVTQERLEELTGELITIFEKCPSRLKKILSSSGRLANSPSMRQLEAGKSAQSQPAQAPSGHANHHHHHGHDDRSSSASVSGQNHHHPSKAHPPRATLTNLSSSQSINNQQAHHLSNSTNPFPPSSFSTISASKNHSAIDNNNERSKVNVVGRNGSLAPSTSANLTPAASTAAAFVAGSTKSNISVIPPNIFNNNSNSGGAYNEQMFDMHVFSDDSNENSDYGQSESGHSVSNKASTLFDEFKMEFSDNEDSVDGKPIMLSSTLMMTETSNEAKSLHLEPSSTSHSNIDYNNRNQQHFSRHSSNLNTNTDSRAFSQLSADLNSLKQQQSQNLLPTTLNLPPRLPDFGGTTATPQINQVVSNSVLSNPLLNQQLGAPVLPNHHQQQPTHLSHHTTHPHSHIQANLGEPSRSLHSSIAMAALATATTSVPSMGFDPSKTMASKFQQQFVGHPTRGEELVEQDGQSDHSRHSKHKKEKKHKEKHKHKDKHKHKHKHKEKNRDRDISVMSSSSPASGPLKLKISKHKLSIDEPEVGGPPVRRNQPIKLKISIGNNVLPTPSGDDNLPEAKRHKASNDVHMNIPQFAEAISATKVGKKV